MEPLAVLLVGAAVVSVAHHLLAAWSAYDQLGGFVGDDPGRWDIVLPAAAQGGSLVNAVVVAVALGLVLVAPGPVGRWGRVALTAVSVVGVVVAALALLGIVEVLRPDNEMEGMWMNADAFGGAPPSPPVVDRVAEVLRWIPSILVAGPSAWFAWRSLEARPTDPLPPVPEDPHAFPEIDLGLDR